MTRASALLIAVAVIAAGCEKKAPPAPGPSTTQSVFTAQLLASNEPTVIQGGEQNASGTVTITITTTRDAAGVITNAVSVFQVNMTGFPTTGTVLTMAHIHEGVAGVNGPIKVNTNLTSGEVTLTNGAGAFSKNSINVPSDVLTGMLNGPSTYYFNVHSSANGGGVIRGQLVKVS